MDFNTSYFSPDTSDNASFVQTTHLCRPLVNSVDKIGFANEVLADPAEDRLRTSAVQVY